MENVVFSSSILEKTQPEKERRSTFKGATQIILKKISLLANEKRS
jgi:hypothetical protein